MDKDRMGYVTKQDFYDFLDVQPQLRSILVDGQVSRVMAGRREDDLREEARQWRHLTRSWNMLTGGKHENLEWAKFVDFFRMRGMLVEYKIKDNPRERLADMLAGIHTRPQDQASETLDEFLRLRSVHLQGQQRCELGRAEATDALISIQQNPHNIGDDGIPKPPSSRDCRRRSSLAVISQSGLDATRADWGKGLAV